MGLHPEMIPAIFAGAIGRWLVPVLVLGGIAVGVGFYGHTRFNAGEAKVRAEWEAASQEAASRFTEALANQQKQLLVVDAELLAARRSTRTVKESLNEALKTPEGMAWADVPLPDGVRLSLGAARHSSMPGDSGQPD